MRSILAVVLSSLPLLSLACSDGECHADEVKVGTVCLERDDDSADADVQDDVDGSSKPTGSSRDSTARDAREPQHAPDDTRTQADTAPDDAAVADASVHASASVDAGTGPACVATTEVCDGADNDCDTLVDEDVKEAPLGENCSNGAMNTCAMMGKKVCFKGEIICSAPPPMPTTEDCDGVDDDCDGVPDDGLVNACGGSMCAADLAKRGTACKTPTPGECQGIGTWECDRAAGNNALRCTAIEKPKTCVATGSCAPLPPETCGDDVDNDCDGQTDEGCKNWYRDCDGDGYAASLSGAVSAASKPPLRPDCDGWTNRKPSDISQTDCDDTLANRHPGAAIGLPVSVAGAMLPPPNDPAYDLVW